MGSVYQIDCTYLVFVRQSMGSDFQNGEGFMFGILLIVQFW